jgi:NhaP-type Na+/H+ or K+/H+ antiporter
MNIAHWAIVIGLLLTTLAIASSWMERLPLSMAMLYLAVGFAIGPAAWGLLDIDLHRHARIIEHLAEIALLISLFSAGMKLGVPLLDRRWLLPLRLATIGMLATVLLTALLGMWWLNLPLATALLLAAIVAPTDPVLAAGVQVADRTDRDRLRFSLTGEGGLNDATALPLLILALDLLGSASGDRWWLRWLLVDVGWSLAAGLVIGGVLGKCIGTLVVHLRVKQQEAVGLDEFLALGLIALSYGIAILAHASGFLAVFAAGIMLQHARKEPDAATLVDFLEGETRSREAAKKLATHPEHAGTFMMKAVRGFNEQLEHVGEVAVVLVVGALLAWVTLRTDILVFAGLLFFVIRPLSVWLSLWRAPVISAQRLLISWFGIRGIGSIYYLMLAVDRHLPPAQLELLIVAVLSTVACSIIAHGVSVTPLMRLYTRQHVRWRRRGR